MRALALAAIAACTHGAPPAAPAAAQYRHGVNVNHWVSSNYDAVHGYGAPWFDREDVAWIARHGFDHIRLRVAMKDWVRTDGTLDPAKLAPIDDAIAWTAAEHLGLVLAATSFPVGDYGEKPVDFGAEPVAASAAATWGLVAQRYAAAGDGLRFELLHAQRATVDRGLPELQRRALAAVRATGARFVYVPAPARDPRTQVAVVYDPEVATSNVVADLAAVGDAYVAQWGVYHEVPEPAQRTYVANLRAALDRRRLAWAIYDYESGCAMRNADGTPTAAYDALGFGPAARETRFALVERGVRQATAVLRREGSDVGMRYEIEDKRRRTSAIVLGADGLPARYDTRSYTGEYDRDEYTIDEQWRREPATAAYYIPKQDDPFTAGLVARWLVEHPGTPLRLIPGGEATAEIVGTLDAGGARLTQVAVLGLDLDPITVWLDANRDPVAILDELGGYIAEPLLAAVPALTAAQTAALAARAEARVAPLAHRPAKGLVVRHARVFDPVTLALVPDRAIAITGGTITAVGANAEVATPAGFEELDAGGRVALPGLWDSHAHLFGRGRALLQLAAGVTSVREMGNETDLPAQIARYDAWTEVGPRAVYAMRFGFAWSTAMPKVETEADARALVDAAAAKGYAQIKVLDDVAGPLVPVLAALAHARGMRFSGHLPKALTVDQFVAAGADELQHVPSLFRGQQGPRAFDAEIARRVALFAKHKVVLDPTLSQFGLADDGSGMSPAEAALASRLPPLLLRTIERDNVPVAAQAGRRAAYGAFERTVRAAVEAGVTVLPGTDGLVPGTALQAELAAFVAAGIPPARVLRMATLDAARTMKRDARSGSLAPGKDGDLVLVDGDPTTDITAVRAVHRVIKAGAVLDPRALLAAAGIRP